MKLIYIGFHSFNMKRNYLFVIVFAIKGMKFYASVSYIYFI